MPDEVVPGVDGEELELLLSFHEQYREEIRGHGKRKSRRYIGGISALAVIFGYAFTASGDVRAWVLIPVVLTVIYFSHLSSRYYVAQLAALIAIIEARIDYPGAEYEFYHGAFSIGANPRFHNDAILPDNHTLSSDETVQKTIGRGMDLIGVLAYFIPGVVGSIEVANRGISDLGITWISLPNGLPDVVIAGSILLLQVALFGLIYRARCDYKEYSEHLARCVEENRGEAIGGVQELEAIRTNPDITLSE